MTRAPSRSGPRSQRFDLLSSDGLDALLDFVAPHDAGGAPVFDDEMQKLSVALRTVSGAPSASETPVAAQFRRSDDATQQEASLRDQAWGFVGRLLQKGGRRLVVVYVHERLSGELFGSAHAFDDPVRDAQAGLYREFWIRDTSRFSRQEPDEKASYRFQIRQAGATIQYTTLDLDAAGPLRSVIEALYDCLDHKELRDKAGMTVERFLRRHKERGLRCGPIPYGWAVEIVDVKGVVLKRLDRAERYHKSPFDLSRLVPGRPHEYKAVATVFRWRLNERLGARTIARRLNGDGILSPRGGKWTDGAVASLLKHPVHCGGLRFFARSNALFMTVENGVATQVKRAPGKKRVHRNKPRSEWLPFVRWNDHAGIVTREEWERAQIGFEEKAPRGSNDHLARERPRLSGRVVCENCGSAMCGRMTVRGLVLRCNGYHTGKSNCPPNPVEDRLVVQQEWRAAADEALGLLETTDLGDRVRARMLHLVEARGQTKTLAVDVGADRRRMREIDARVKLAFSGLSQETLQAVDAEIKELKAEKAALEQRIAATKRSLAPLRKPDLAPIVEAAMARIDRLKRSIEDMPASDVRALIQALCVEARCAFEIETIKVRRRSKLVGMKIEVRDVKALVSIVEQKSRRRGTLTAG